MTCPKLLATTDCHADSSPLVGASRYHGKPSKPSLRDAINAKCRECIYDPLSGMGTWREQVGVCTSRACPLYPVRPLPKPRKGGAR